MSPLLLIWLQSGPPALPRRATAAEVSLVGLAALAILSLFFAFGTERVGLRLDDADQYYRMAETANYLARLPYSFRVLTPMLAGHWPGGITAGFAVVTVSALALACATLYAYQRALGLGAVAASAGALLFAVSGGSIRLLTTPAYVDGATYLAEAAALFFLGTGRFRLFLVALVLGVLNRETVLLLIPVYLAAAPRETRSAGKALLVVVLPTLALVALAGAKLSAGGVFDGSTPASVLAPFARTFQHTLPTVTELFDLYSTLGVLWLLALPNLPGPTAFQRRALVYGALVVAQLIVSRGDEGRNLSHLFVLVIPLAMLEVERAVGRAGAGLGAVLAVACGLSMVHARWTFLEPTTLRYMLVAFGSLATLGIVAWARRPARTLSERQSFPG